MKFCGIVLLLFSIFLYEINSSYSFTNTAILNMHWGMNPEQVESAINTALQEDQSSTDKIKVYISNLQITDRGRPSDVKYYFYKNQLYKLKIKQDLATHKKPIINQLIKLKGLDEQFNDIVQSLHYGRKYETFNDNQKIVFYLNSGDLNSSDTVFLDLKYLPVAGQTNFE
ncbi:MAG TPA: hypothetical protein VLB82_14380 [Thermodesulfobacteriota bacterium]|nr:hypothetical protein [Thermodesulfobacteriota bacterium]